MDTSMGCYKECGIPETDCARDLSSVGISVVVSGSGMHNQTVVQTRKGLGATRV